MPADISVVLPTYNRAAALAANFGSLLALDGIREIVVVDDGSTDDTPQTLSGFHDPRVRVVRAPENRGSPAARNTGAAAATSEWILFADDDCYLPPDYATVLRRAAEQHGADIVSAPWLHPVDGEDRAATIARARAHPVARIGPATPHHAMPAAPLRTPFLSGIALVRRDVFEAVRYDERYRVNAWREETSFFIAANEAGFVTLLTPETASFEAGFWAGGQRVGGLRYEAWVARNNWRFLRRHRGWLRENGHLRTVVGAQTAFLLKRWPRVIRGALGARLRRS